VVKLLILLLFVGPVFGTIHYSPLNSHMCSSKDRGSGSVPSSMIDLDDVFGDLGDVWDAYKEDDSKTYYGPLLFMRGYKKFKALYLLGEDCRIDKATSPTVPRLAIDYYEMAIVECEKDISAHIDPLTDELAHGFMGDSGREKLKNEIHRLNLYKETYDKERAFVKRLAQEKRDYCQDLIRKRDEAYAKKKRHEKNLEESGSYWLLTKIFG
jgi:hypothetical protein